MAEKNYRMFILHDKRLLINGAKGRQAPYDIDYLKQLYTEAGLTVTVIDAAALAGKKTFNNALCDILVIPSGPVFPSMAEENFKAFVSGGGRVITLGGFAFSRVLDVTGIMMEKEISTSLGTNKPQSTDDGVVRYNSGSMPLFDMDYTYQGAVTVKAHGSQAIFKGEADLSANPLSGYSAVTVIGDNKRRWQPLLEGYDINGGRIGTVGALLYLNSRDFDASTFVPTWNNYRNSAIAFFGVTNQDITKNKALRDGFQKLPFFMMEGTYVGVIRNKYDCYRQGENPVITARLENTTQKDMSGHVVFRVTEEDSGKTVFEQQVPFTSGKRSCQDITVTWKTAGFDDDFYVVSARTYNDSNELTDICLTGFSVWNTEVIAKGPRYVYEDNYIKLIPDDKTKQTVLISGADDGPEIFLTDYMTPLVWRQDFIDRRDMGMNLYENLQQYSWAGDTWIFNTEEERERYYRKVDNAVYLSQKYNQIYKMGIAIMDNCALTPENMGTSIETASYLARRYKDVPGLIYYLNGDMIIRPDDSLKADFNDFLKNKYKTDAALQASWGDASLKLGMAELNAGRQATGWSDMQAWDIKEYKIFVTNRWTKTLSDVIRSIDKSGKAILCEFYAFPSELVDVNTMAENLTYSNIGWFYDATTFSKTYATTDMRAIGKSGGIGEYGLPAASLLQGGSMYHTTVHPQDTIRNFTLNIFHTAFAMGASHVQYWGFQEGTMYTSMFSVNRMNDAVHRDLFYWLRNSSLFARQLRPVYTVPEVAVLMPDQTRLSSDGLTGHYAMQNLFDVLQKMQLGNILTISDTNPVIDPSIKVIFYPLSYNPGDRVYNKLKKWVEGGGHLYLSGDISYDETRRQTKTNRLNSLAGVRLKKQLSVALDTASGQPVTYTVGGHARNGRANNEIETAGAAVTAADQSGRPVFTVNSLGKGKVWFNADAAEMFLTDNSAEANMALYRQVLAGAGVKSIKTYSKQNNIKLLTQTLADGEKLFCICNTDNGNGTEDFTFTAGAKTYTVASKAARADTVVTDKNGCLKAVFVEGSVFSGNRLLVDNPSYSHIYTRDGLPLEKSRNLVVTPLETGKTVIATAAPWQKLIAVYGQIVDGVFIRYGTAESRILNGTIELDITDRMVNTIILVCEKDGEQRLVQAIEKSITEKVSASV